jgi:hypothetical protein
LKVIDGAEQKNKRMIARTLPFFNWQPSTYVVTPAAILSGQAGGASTGKDDNFFVKIYGHTP